MSTPLAPIMNIQGNVLSFHNKEADYLIFLGESDCDTFLGGDCHSEAFYSHDNGRTWHSIGTYIRNCIWGRDGSIEKAELHSVFCEQYHDRKGNQRSFFGNPVQFISSVNYFTDREHLFDDIAGVAVFGPYMIVAAVSECIVNASAC